MRLQSLIIFDLNFSWNFMFACNWSSLTASESEQILKKKLNKISNWIKLNNNFIIALLSWHNNCWTYATLNYCAFSKYLSFLPTPKLKQTVTQITFLPLSTWELIERGAVGHYTTITFRSLLNRNKSEVQCCHSS